MNTSTVVSVLSLVLVLAPVLVLVLVVLSERTSHATDREQADNTIDTSSGLPCVDFKSSSSLTSKFNSRATWHLH
jgi:hypothetical protein